MTYPVKYFHSGQADAPIITGNSPGSILALLKGALVTGLRVLAPTSVTISGGVATATFVSGTFAVGEIIAIDGATPSALNGEAIVTASGVASCSWATAASGAVSGTISIRLAPAGWTVPFEDTGRAVFQSGDPASSLFYYRIEDTAGQSARIRGFETMSDVDTGAMPFPTNSQISGGGYLWKSSVVNGTPIRWKIFVSSRTVLLAFAAGTGMGAGNHTAPLRGFGDAIEEAPGGDPWSSFVSYSGSTVTNSQTGPLNGGGNFSATGATVVARSRGGIGGALQINAHPFVGNTGSESGADGTLGSLSGDIAGRLRLSKIYFQESSGSPRAGVPGVYRIPQSAVLGTLNDGDLVDGGDALPGRVLVAVVCGPFYNGTPAGIYLVDITGPW